MSKTDQRITFRVRFARSTRNADNWRTVSPIYSNKISLSSGDHGASPDIHQCYIRPICSENDFFGLLQPISAQLAEMLKVWNLPVSGLLFSIQF